MAQIERHQSGRVKRIFSALPIRGKRGFPEGSSSQSPILFRLRFDRERFHKRAHAYLSCPSRSLNNFSAVSRAEIPFFGLLLLYVDLNFPSIPSWCVRSKRDQVARGSVMVPFRVSARVSVISREETGTTCRVIFRGFVSSSRAQCRAIIMSMDAGMRAGGARQRSQR